MGKPFKTTKVFRLEITATEVLGGGEKESKNIANWTVKSIREYIKTLKTSNVKITMRDDDNLY